MSRLTPPVGSGDHVLGDPRAPVTLVEFGDFECPQCGRAHRVLQQVLPRLSAEARFVFRHFPLAEIHPHALAAAEVAEAAGAQGKFWPMHDTLFEHQDALDPEDLLAYAAALDLDVPRFTRELVSGAHRDKVRRDFSSGVKSGVNGTPTFFVQGVRLDLPWDADTLLAAVRAAVPAA
jgi:protein-disulfide isomerase